ncbi:MAG: DUF3795 domain-containing protein [Treponema sp.]|jgi:hypothetical protein|nr:DUF3795 domain-containing protein [Treponema sp.]
MAGITYPIIGACGIDCGLCPRYYTDGTSRCPGCGGDGFGQKHPSCGFLTCCVRKKGLPVCSQCGEFPCIKYADKEKIVKDSFVSHKRMFINHKMIQDKGLDQFLASQAERIVFLETALKKHNDGRSKNYYCIAAALLTTASLQKALRRAGAGENLKTVLAGYAEIEGQELKLL